MKSAMLFLAGIFMMLTGYSQGLMHSVGGTLSFTQARGTENTAAYSIFHRSFTYYPRYNVLANERSSLSIGAPLSIGFGTASSMTDAGLMFSYDLPLVIDFNLGARSTPENEKNFGGYIGAGFGYSKIKVSESMYSDFTGTSYGPMVRGGIRFLIDGWSQGISVGGFYKKGLEKEKLRYFGMNLLCDF